MLFRVHKRFFDVWYTIRYNIWTSWADDTNISLINKFNQWQTSIYSSQASFWFGTGINIQDAVSDNMLENKYHNTMRTARKNQTHMFMRMAAFVEPWHEDSEPVLFTAPDVETEVLPLAANQEDTVDVPCPFRFLSRGARRDTTRSRGGMRAPKAAHHGHLQHENKGVREWIINYIHIKLWNIIAQPFINFNHS